MYRPGRLLKIEPAFEYQVQTEQVNRYGLDGLRRWRSGMLRGVGIDCQPVHAPVMEIAVLFGQYFPVNRPAGGRSADILVHRPVCFGQQRPAARAGVGVFKRYQ